MPVTCMNVGGTPRLHRGRRGFESLRAHRSESLIFRRFYDGRCGRWWRRVLEIAPTGAATIQPHTVTYSRAQPPRNPRK